MAMFGTSSSTKPKFLRTVFQQLNMVPEEDILIPVKHINDNPAFHCFIAFLIFLNGIMLGLEVDLNRGQELSSRLGFFIVDFISFLIYCFELTARFRQKGWDSLQDGWNFLDYCLVVMQLLDTVRSVSDEGSSIAAVVRITRALRIVRQIKGLKAFSGLWLVIRGILDSARTIFWVTMLLLIIAYCLAVGIATTAPDDNIKEYWIHYDVYFGSVGRCFWTVLQLMTFDSWASDIARPLADHNPVALFLVYLTIITCSFAVLNIILSVMIENTIACAKGSVDQTGKVLKEAEADVYASMDDDFLEVDMDEGELTEDQLEQLIETKSFNYKLRLLGLNPEEVGTLFEVIDADQSGRVSPEELISALKQIRGQARGQDMVALISFVQRQQWIAVQCTQRAEALIKQADGIEARLLGLGAGIAVELVHQKKQQTRAKALWKEVEARQAVISDSLKVRWPRIT
eukprot:TRINITY_DN54839_c0_g1_i1.p1 TRINITY_DN54839_c0_g1~~TRINITY_DN54839_c0_g1_i1.p1  ORF type:complete len:484 (-),score=89.92 TRINITY_DN54839_c0_g1_i1:139-1512(-)